MAVKYGVQSSKSLKRQEMRVVTREAGVADKDIPGRLQTYSHLYL